MISAVSRYLASLNDRFRDALRQRPARVLTFTTIIVADLVLLCVLLGRFWPAPDVLSPLVLHGLAIAIFAAAALLIKKHEIAILTFGVVATLGAHAWLGLSGDKSINEDTSRQFGIASLKRASADGSLKVISINTWHSLRNTSAMRDYLARERADVVVMTEMGPGKIALLEDLKAVYPHQIHCASQWPCGVALISRLPISDFGAARVALEQPPLVWARIKNIGTDLGHVTVVGTHLHRPSRDPWLHEAQVSSLIRFLSYVNGPTVLAGDFNTAPWSSSFKRLMLEAWMFPALQLKPTWPVWPVALPQVALDHVLVSADLTIARSGTGPAVGSDHLPVWSEILLPIARGPQLQAPRRGHPVKLRLAAASHLEGELAADLGSEHGAARYLRR